jgi:hypothetical protein
VAGEDSGAEDELSRSEEEGDSEVEDEEDEESSTHSEDDHTESEDEEDEGLCTDSDASISDSDSEEDEESKAPRPRAKSGFHSCEDSGNWTRNRTDCMDASPACAAGHDAWFPPKETFARGWRVVRGYDGGDIQQGDLVYANTCENVPGVLTGEHNLSSLNPASVAELERCLHYPKPASLNRTARSVRLRARAGQVPAHPFS